jgi:hypothetical protein
MIDRWVRSHKIGLAAHLLSLTNDQMKAICHPSKETLSSGEVGSLEAQTKGFESEDIIDEALDVLIREWNAGHSEDSNFGRSLPPVVIHLLLTIPNTASRLGEMAQNISSLAQSLISLLGLRRINSLIEGGTPNKRIVNILKQEREKAQAGKQNHDHENFVPVYQRAVVLAHHILDSTAKPIWIIRLGRELFGNSWRPLGHNKAAIELLRDVLEVLRSPSAKTHERCRATETVSSVMARSKYWKQVENALYHQLFAWPLILVGNESAVSLPVAVDVYFDDMKDSFIEGNDEIITDGWKESLRYATQAARQMWLWKHNNCGSYRDRVEKASAVFDFSIASRMVAALPVKFALEQASMQAYFSQIVLSRFLGKCPSPARIATGSIGKQIVTRSNPETSSNYEFIWPEGIDKKLHYAFQTYGFERIILPMYDKARRAEIDEIFGKYRNSQTIEINFVYGLDNAADVFQVGQWRQFRYIRCPDVAWHIHSHHRPLPPPESEKLNLCLSLLQRNEQTILELPDDVNAADLAGALWHINTRKRTEISPPYIPPMLTWAFVRATPQEQDERFWQIVWRLVGAPEKDFDEFYQTAATNSSAQLLAKALNGFWPTENHPRQRAPDILIIIGTQYFIDSLAQTKNPMLRPLAFYPIIEQLRQPDVLRTNLGPAMKNMVGNTRIILLRQDVEATSDSGNGQLSLSEFEDEILSELSLLRLRVEEQALFDSLSIFRYGFTHKMADLLWMSLGFDVQRTPQLLRNYVKKGHLRYIGGEYYIPNKIGIEFAPTVNSEGEAKMHFSAGIALAPYLAITPVPSLALDEAFNPEYVHEAQYHLFKARRLFDKGIRNNSYNIARKAHQRLIKFVDYGGWYNVQRLLKDKNAQEFAYELSMELIESGNKAGIKIHPVKLFSAAEAALTYWHNLTLGNTLRDQNKLQHLRDQVDQLFNWAEEACDYEEFKDERPYNLLKVITSRVVLLHQYGPSLGEKELRGKLEDLTSQALKLIDSGADGHAAHWAWYELIADTEPLPTKAEKLYELGVKWHPNCGSLWIKLIGSSYLGRSSKDKANTLCNNLTIEQVERILQVSLPGIYKDNKRGSGWVKGRWEKGIKQLYRVYGSIPLLERHWPRYAEALHAWSVTKGAS